MPGIFDDDIARIEADVLIRKANMIAKMSEHQDCSCHPSSDHSHNCPKGIWLRIAHMLRMDAEG